MFCDIILQKQFFRHQFLNMKIDSFPTLFEELEKTQIFHHEIKGKRLRKQLKALSQMEPQSFSFQSFQILQTAILIHISLPVDSSNVLLSIKLDNQYPFNQPQFLINDQNKPQLSFCKDYLSEILKEQMWGPSIIISAVLDKIPQLTKKIGKNQQMQWKYHNCYDYGREELQKSGVKLFEGEQYKWGFKVIKTTKKKVFGLTPEAFLILEEKSNHNHFVLESWTLISELKEVKANMGKNKYSLEFSDSSGNKVYLGGPLKDIEEILKTLNPIEMIQRKIEAMEKSGQTPSYEEAVNMYSTLIEHYSLTNKTKMEKYMERMKKTISNQYSASEEYGKEQKMVEIQT